MHIRSVIVGSRVGLHARPATTIAEAADEFDTDVLIALPGGEPVEANSALLIMSLGAGPGVTVEVSGEDEGAVIAIATLVEMDLDAP